jgi:hypothetical protein
MLRHPEQPWLAFGCLMGLYRRPHNAGSYISFDPTSKAAKPQPDFSAFVFDFWVMPGYTS